MQILSIIAILGTSLAILMNYHNFITINILSRKFAVLMNLSPHSYTLDLGIYTFVIFVLGAFSVLFFFAPLYGSLKEKYVAYKRELEKGSITNTSAEAKINVLENKITVLEKALDDALRRNN